MSLRDLGAPKSLAALDARYVNETDAAPLALAGQTPSQAPVAPASSAAVGSLAFTARADHAHPSAGLYAAYGTGADGAMTIDGTNTYAGVIQKITATSYKLMKNVNASSVTVSAGITIDTAGFLFRAQTLTGPGGGSATFTCAPPALSGTNQQTVPGGTTSMFANGGRYGYFGYGRIGAGGVTGVGAAAPSLTSGGSTGVYGYTIANLPGTTVNGAGGSGTSGAGGAGLANPSTPAPDYSDPLTAFEGLVRALDAAAANNGNVANSMGVVPLLGGVGGASGAGDGTNAGGGGGQGGNSVIVSARVVTGNVIVTSPGQAGGTPTVGNCGGGGGGSGGAALLNSTDLTGWTGSVSAPGGAGGSGVGTGAAGTPGVAGVAVARQWA